MNSDQFWARARDINRNVDQSGTKEPRPEEIWCHFESVSLVWWEFPFNFGPDGSVPMEFNAILGQGNASQ